MKNNQQTVKKEKTPWKPDKVDVSKMTEKERLEYAKFLSDAIAKDHSVLFSKLAK